MPGSKPKMERKPQQRPQDGSHSQDPQGNVRPQSVITDDTHRSTIAEVAKTYPCCDCPCDGPHSPNCMFHLYHEMRDNYQLTTDLARQYINQMTKDPIELEIERRLEEAKQDIYRLLSQQNNDKTTVRPDQHERPQTHSRPKTKPPQFGINQGMFGEGNMQQLLMNDSGNVRPESQTRKLMEEQRKMKNLWAQFMNIFDMALDLADEASNARWMLNFRRKEDERLACKKRIEEAAQDRYKHCLDKQADSRQQEQQSKEKDKKGQKSKGNDKQGQQSKEKDQQGQKNKENNQQGQKSKENDQKEEQSKEKDKIALQERQASSESNKEEAENNNADITPREQEPNEEEAGNNNADITPREQEPNEEEAGNNADVTPKDLVEDPNVEDLKEKQD